MAAGPVDSVIVIIMLASCYYSSNVGTPGRSTVPKSAQFIG